MYTYYNYEYSVIQNNTEVKQTISYNSEFDSISKFLELCEMILKSLKLAEKANVFTLSLYALDNRKAQKELAEDSWTNYHGDLWTCTEGNKAEGFYFSPSFNNFEQTIDFVITAKSDIKKLMEVSPFKKIW